jgi:hypothetical protein
VLCKTQIQQNKKQVQNQTLVAPTRRRASIINFSGGDAFLKPKHLSFLVGGIAKIITVTKTQ